MSKITAIVLAAGNGRRMNSSTKKQFMMIKDKPVLLYALLRFQQSQVDEIILVTGADDIDYCVEQIVKKHHITKVNAVVEGGAERHESVLKGLKKASGDIVLIHDGARPFVTDDIISRCIEATKKYGACVAGVPVKDTIKIVGKDGIVNETPDRAKLWITQTPQCFDRDLICDAYSQIPRDYDGNITDDAMIVEQFTEHCVRFVKGAYQNIKITTPEDLVWAEMIVDQQGK